MKDIFLFINICLVLCCSCQDSIMNNVENQESANVIVTTRVVTSFDMCEKAVLGSGCEVKLPWTTSSTNSIPDEIRVDVAEADGWRVLYSTVQIVGCNVDVTDADVGTNYLLLYNLYTGILKGFVYVEGDIPSNNHAFWMLTTDRRTTLFNFSEAFAKPMDSPDSPQILLLSTVSKNGITQGFEKGWNCFMTELAYDENSINEKLSISGFSLNESNITLIGSHQSTNSGTIVTSTQNKSSIIDGIATGFGQAGKEWLKEEIGTSNDKVIKFGSTVLQSVMEKGITGIVSTGLYKVFGSLLGTTKTTYDINFTTNGTIKIEGKSTTPSSGLIAPLSGIPLNGLNQNLGVWNLATNPVSTLDAYAELQKCSNINGGTIYYYKVKHFPSMEFKMNPAVVRSITPTIEMVQYDRDIRVPVTRPDGTVNIAYRDVNDKILYCDDVATIKETENNYNIYIANVLPKNTVNPSIPAFNMRDNRYYINDRLVFKVKTTMGGPQFIYSAKTFIPKFKYNANQSARPYTWTLQELIKLGYHTGIK